MKNLIFNGGIYGIYFQDILLYIGKTTDNFNIRFSAHKLNIDNRNRTEKFYNYCYDNNIQSSMLGFKILFDCKNCPLSAEQIECLETNYINEYKPLYNEKKIKQQDTLLNFSKQNFPQLNKEQQEYILYLYKNLSKSAFGIALILLLFDGIDSENYNLNDISRLLDIKKTAYYDGIKELKKLQLKEVEDE